MTIRRLKKRERGAGLFVVILIVAGLAALGTALWMLTSMGPKMSGGMRSQSEAFNAAEAGFGAAQKAIKGAFGAGTWTDFGGHYLTSPSNIDLPSVSGVVNASYFRRVTDQDLILSLDPGKDGTPDFSPLLFFRQTFAKTETGATDSRLVYTAFLINDEAGGGTVDNLDALLVVIGEVLSGTKVIATTRLEILLEYESAG